MKLIHRSWCNLRDFLDNHIDPAEQLAQVLVGVIMAMSITMYARSTLKPPQQAQVKAESSSDEDDDSAAPDDPWTMKQTINQVLGCNLVWGVITGVMYLMNSVYDRSLPMRLQRDVRDAEDDDAEAMEAVEEELDAGLRAITTEEERARLYAQIVERQRAGPVPRVRRFQGKDITIALIIWFLVAITAIPALMPFLFISDMLLALRVANLLLIAITFVVGYCWGRVVLMNPWGTGFSIMLLGVVMAVAAEYLGG